MTFEEQFHNIIQLLEAAASLGLRNEQAIKRLMELEEIQSRSVTKLAETIEASHNSLVSAHNTLVAEIAGYVADSRERIKQMEANLDALIRIITAEHSNGKGKL